MKLSLSTNWCNRRIESGREIAARAAELGFEELELGFHTTEAQALEIRECGTLPIGSIHAFCPVPLSAPQGYPELYLLASFDEPARLLARTFVRKNILFAAKMGADAVVLHAGRIRRDGWFRARRSRKLVEILKRELAALLPDLEHARVTLGLENLPTRDGFPNMEEVQQVTGEWVRPWYDTGHGFVMGEAPVGDPVGIHVNDSVGGDDHLAAGEGHVDFKAIKPVMERARHIVFEPNSEVTEEALVRSIALIKGL